jgi:hypothetical protein
MPETAHLPGIWYRASRNWTRSDQYVFRLNKNGKPVFGS